MTSDGLVRAVDRRGVGVVGHRVKPSLLCGVRSHLAEHAVGSDDAMSREVRTLCRALEALSDQRLRRLVGRLEREPDVAVTVGAWRPQCPMVLAGFDPGGTALDTPEERFAFVWDNFATPAGDASPRRKPGQPTSWPARRSETRALLRAAQRELRSRVDDVRSRRQR
jgi:hypothetical protein